MHLQIAEASPHDYFWGAGFEGSGTNHLGRLLMLVRAELLAAAADEQPAQEGASSSSSAQPGRSPAVLASAYPVSEGARKQRRQGASLAPAGAGGRRVQGLRWGPVEFR